MQLADESFLSFMSISLMGVKAMKMAFKFFFFWRCGKCKVGVQWILWIRNSKRYDFERADASNSLIRRRCWILHSDWSGGGGLSVPPANHNAILLIRYCFYTVVTAHSRDNWKIPHHWYSSRERTNTRLTVYSCYDVKGGNTLFLEGSGKLKGNYSLI